MQYQENIIRREKSKRWSVLHRKPEEIELTEKDKELAIVRAIQQRGVNEYWKGVESPPEVKNLSAKEYFNAFCNQWKITKDNEKVVKLLCFYFSNDKKFEELGYSLNKGILLAGCIGCGKTTIMRFFSKNLRQRYAVRSVREISYQFSQSGIEALEPYNQNIYCFDDLGTEKDLSHYGNIINVMADVLLNRYDRHLTTHLTTNLTATQIEETYKGRVASRMIEMFNIIQFPKGSKDLRE